MQIELSEILKKLRATRDEIVEFNQSCDVMETNLTLKADLRQIITYLDAAAFYCDEACRQVQSQAQEPPEIIRENKGGNDF